MAEIKPQAGKQELFLTTPADIAIYGGGAGGGKSWSLLIEALRHVKNGDFGAVIFRRTSPQITNEGGLWDESSSIYSHFDAIPNAGRLRWKFQSGAKITFAHMQYEQNRFDWQGSQIPLIGFDELTHFTWRQFTYMLSRNRSTCGIKPYIRATCNPDPDSWVADFISWWIDQKTGLAIDERAGVVRWFYMINDAPVWGDSADELMGKYGHQFEKPDGSIIPPKSCTFINSTVYDNAALLEKNPEYLANLKSLPMVERERLLGGNWKIRESAGMYFRSEYFDLVRDPIEGRYARGWDLASTEPSTSNPDPDYTAGVLMGVGKDGRYCIANVVRDQLTPAKVERLILDTARRDGRDVVQCFFTDPAQAGKAQKLHITRLLRGFKVRFIPATKGKVEMAMPVSAQAEAGNICMVRGMWNREFLYELEAFPEGTHDDMVDGMSRAFLELSLKNVITGVRSITQ